MNQKSEYQAYETGYNPSYIRNPKNDYLFRLREQLKKLPPDELDDAMGYYDEYLSEAEREGTLDRKLASLGSPREAALNILKDKAYKEIEVSPPSASKGFKAVWLTILGIFASPIAIPIGLGIAMVVFGLVIAVFSLAFGVAFAVLSALFIIGAASVALIAAGIAGIVLSGSIFFTHIPSGFFFMGCGLLSLGAGAVLGLVTFRLIRLCLKIIKTLFGKWLPNLFKNIFPKRRKAAL